MPRRPRPAFTLLELLVVVAIIGLLVSVLVPSLARARQQGKRTACAAHLRQVGLALQSYRHQHADRFPAARSMPEPWVVLPGLSDPPLFEALGRELPRNSAAWACPGDAGYVHARGGISYLYNTNLSGQRPQDLPLHRLLKAPVSEIPVAFDFDGLSARTPEGVITVPFFHVRRNLLFADSHVGEFRPSHLNSPAPPGQGAP